MSRRPHEPQSPSPKGRNNLAQGKRSAALGNPPPNSAEPCKGETPLIKAIFAGIDMFFPMCDGLDLTEDQRFALAKWIAQNLRGETIAWRDVDHELPDADMTVLLSSPDRR